MERPGPVYPAIAGLACIIYLNCLPNETVYDDQTIIDRNPRLESPLNLRQLWLTDWWYVPPDRTEERHRDRLYRPLVMHSFALNHAISGTRTWSYHAADIGLHALCCVLVLSLGRALFDDPRIGACSAILFAVLPVHSESVAYIVGRADVAGALFCLLGMLCVVRELKSRRAGRRMFWRTSALLCVPLGLFCKEQAACLPGLLLVTEWYLRTTGRMAQPDRGPSAHEKPRGTTGLIVARFFGFYLWALLACGGYLLLRYVALDGRLMRDVIPSALDNPLSQSTFSQRLWMPFKLLAQYAVVTVWPANLCVDYSYNSLSLPSSPADPMVLCGGLLCIAAVWAGVRSYRRRRMVLFAILCFAVSYALISNTFVVIGTICGERLFYLPSAAVCWLLAFLAVAILKTVGRSATSAGVSLRAAPALGWIIVAVLSLRTVIRTFDWRSGPRLFAVDVQTHPNSARLQFIRGLELVNHQDWDAALEHLNRSLAIFPEYADAHGTLGYVYAMNGDWPTAEKHYYLSLQLWRENPKLQTQFESFRRLYETGGTLPLKDLGLVEQAAATQPADSELQLRLADLQAATGKYRDAIATMTALLERRPDDRELRFRLSSLLIIDEQVERAREMLEAILAQDPDDWRAHTHLALVLCEIDPAASLRHARRAAELEPMRFEVRMNLVQALELNGRSDEALAELRRLLSMLAANEPARLLVERQIRLIEERY